MSLVSFTDLAEDTTPPNYLIDGMLEAETICEMFGASQSFKSFIALDMGLCIATERPWNNRVVKQGSLVYIAYEGSGGLKRRIRAWSLHNEIKPDNAYLFEKPGALSSNEGAEAMANSIDAGGIQPTLVVVDTLSKAMAGANENSAEETNAVIRRAEQYFRDRFGCAVMFIHHTGHGNGGRARGSSALHAGIDVEMRVERMRETMFSTINITKMKDGEIPAKITMKLETVDLGYDEPVTSLVCTSTTENPLIGRAANDENDVFCVLKCLTDHQDDIKRKGKGNQINKSKVGELTGLGSKRVTTLLAAMTKAQGSFGNFLSPKNSCCLTNKGKAFLEGNAG